MLFDDLDAGIGVGRGSQERGNICMHMADSHCCTEETNTISSVQLLSCV